jgi:SAM-dependent methyltransferase
VIDVGCGVGTWLSVFEEHGVQDILGIDGSTVPELLYVDGSKYLSQDLKEPLIVGRKFDLVVCLEVAEHLPADRAENFVANLAALGDNVLFSAAIPFQGGTDHQNEQWPEFWIGLFDRSGFTVSDMLRPKIWADESVDFWYRQNVLLFRRLAKTAEASPREEGLSFGGNSLVHPIQLARIIERMSERIEVLEASNTSLRDALQASRDPAKLSLRQTTLLALAVAKHFLAKQLRSDVKQWL